MAAPLHFSTTLKTDQVLPTHSSSRSNLAPLLKWPGGKRTLIPELMKHIPTEYNRYYEAFCGGAALYFKLHPCEGYLSDTNAELIECYQAVSEEAENVIKCLERLRNTEKDYYEVRRSKPISRADRAARMIYLCRLSFNGIYRVNLAGQYNVPYGHKTHLTTHDADHIRRVSDVLKRTTISHGDFEKNTAQATEHDLVYFDPPYTVAHSNNGFVKYNRILFSWADQQRLALVAERLRLLGSTVIVSNASHISVRELYPNFVEHQPARFSRIAANKSARKLVSESIFVGKSE